MGHVAIAGEMLTVGRAALAGDVGSVARLLYQVQWRRCLC